MKKFIIKKKMEVTQEQLIDMIYIAAGIPGAIRVIGEFMQLDNGDLILSELKRKNIIGSDVWMIYKKNGNNIEEFVKEILS